MAIKEQTSEGNLFPDMPTTPATVPASTPKKRGRKPLVREPEPRPDLTKQGGRIKMRSPPKVLTGNFRPSQLSFFLS